MTRYSVRVALLVLGSICLSAVAAGAAGLAMGDWDVTGDTYGSASAGRALYFLTDQPRLSGEGTVEATVTVRERTAQGGWAAAAVLLASDPQSFWTLSLVEAPDGTRYTELVESYLSVHQAQGSGATRLVQVAGTFDGAWEYGRPYRLRLGLTARSIVGDITDATTGQALAHLGCALAGAPALREGWATLRNEALAASFTGVTVTAPAGAEVRGAGRDYPQGAKGCVGLYLGDKPAEAAGIAGTLGPRLARRGFATVTLTPEALAQEGSLCFPQLRYLVADLRRMPADALPGLNWWIMQGGVLLSATAPAFGEFIAPAPEGWESWDAHVERTLAGLGKAARTAVSWSASELTHWSQIKGFEGERSAVPEVDPEAAPGEGAALRVTVPHFRSGWWALKRAFDAPPAAEGDRLVCFWARGDGKTPELSLELTEKDGSRWVAVISLGDKWGYHALPIWEFRYWPDNRSVGRGGQGDQVHLGDVVAMQWGLSNSHTQAVLNTDASEHTVRLGPVGFAPAAPETLAGLAPPARPDMEAVSPGYKLHDVPGATGWEATELGQMWGLPAKLGAASACGAIERPTGEGFDRGRWWRWVPLVAAHGAKGEALGATMSLVLGETLPNPRSAWVSLGLRDVMDLEQADIQEAVAATLDRLASAPMLFEGGAKHFLPRPGEELKLGAHVVSHALAAQEVTVEFRLTGARRATREATASVAPQGMATVQETLPGLAAGQYQLTTELRAGGQVVDRIVQPLTVRARPVNPPPASQIVRREGGGFTLNGRAWHPVGCNYWPHYLGGMPGGAYRQSWLSPLLYDPSVVEADLAQMERWGFTAIAGVGADVQLSGEGDNATIRNMEDFLWRCWAHHIRVVVFCRGLDPRGRDTGGAQKIIAALRNHPALLGWDIAWEPGYGGARDGYLPQWKAWLEEQYGSLEQAEQDLGHGLPRGPGGELVTPPDRWFETNGAWRGVAAAYRSFWDQAIGREYRESARIVRAIDPLHLVGFRGSNVVGPTQFKPVEQPTVLHFMDWAGPEGYDVPAYGRLTPWPQVSNRGLATRMLSYLSGGKPVVWMEFGMPIYPNGTTWQDYMIQPGAGHLSYQVEEGQRWWQMMVDSGAQGSFVWWYTGGFRVGENSDCGLVQPNNQPRPVARTAQEYARRTVSGEGRPVDRWLTMRPEVFTGGWVGEYLRLRDRYAELVEAGHGVGVCTEGTGTIAARCPLTTPAGDPWPGRGPLRFLNLVFERIRVRGGDGQWVEVPLPTRPGQVAEISLPAGGPVEVEAWAGNLGEATWQAHGEGPVVPNDAVGAGSGLVWLTRPNGAVVLGVTGDETAQSALESDTPFQGSGHFGVVQVAERLDKPLALRLRGVVTGRAAMGEIVALHITPR